MFIKDILSFEEFNIVPAVVFHVCEIANGETLHPLHPEQAIRAYLYE